MRRYNFFRPLLIILVAFVVNNLARLICVSLGAAPETTDMVAVLAMVAAAVITYMRLTRQQRK